MLLDDEDTFDEEQAIEDHLIEAALLAEEDQAIEAQIEDDMIEASIVAQEEAAIEARIEDQRIEESIREQQERTCARCGQLQETEDDMHSAGECNFCHAFYADES